MRRETLSLSRKEADPSWGDRGGQQPPRQILPPFGPDIAMRNMRKPIENAFLKASVLVRIARVMQEHFGQTALVAEALKAFAAASSAAVPAEVNPALRAQARTALQEPELERSVLEAVDRKADVVQLFNTGGALARGNNWEPQHLGRALLILAEFAFMAMTDPKTEVVAARQAAYQGVSGLEGEVKGLCQAFDCSLSNFLPRSSDRSDGLAVAIQRNSAVATQPSLFAGN